MNGDEQIAGFYMSNEIRILPEDLVDKIAAGEVVERPASVVKELVENSIDAGAGNIDVEIKNGGIKYIRVTDDGMGMDERNALLAFERHATSKIKTTDDLFRIATLGFRGEALPSIAAVCFLDILTRTEESLSGTRIKIEGGVAKETKQMGSPVGTSVIVRELFYNVPARRKFLKTVLTETRHVIDLVTKFAICYPQVSFKLKSDERELFNFPAAADLHQRVSELFPKNQLQKCIEVRSGGTLPDVFGFLGKPEIARSNRAELYLFVNRRPIVSRSLYHAIQSGYGELLPKGKYPFAILLVNVDPQLVDVNVHPTKSEVRFVDERGMYDLVHTRVKEHLTSPEVIPQFGSGVDRTHPEHTGRPADLAGTRASVDRANRPSPPIDSIPFIRESAERSQPSQESFLVDPRERQAQAPVGGSQTRDAKDVSADKKVKAGVGDLWQLANTYILTQIKGSLMILDQHAAHERILYEEALRNLQGPTASSQQVLFPTVVELTPQEFHVLEQYQDLIRKLGFEIKHFGGRSVLVTAVPSIVRKKSGEVLLREILSQVQEEGKQEKDKVRVVAKSFACHGSVQAGETLTREEMRHLVEKLFSSEEPYSCPHGRPTVVNFPLSELNKRFGRN
jgi:DNA mismatch repair protein MutL